MIICCGEALIDMLPRALPEGDTGFLPVPGGAVLNTAVALGRLGEPVGFFSGLSSDLFGARLEAHLRASHVDTTLCARSARPTTLAFVELVDGAASYVFYDENTAGRLLDGAAIPAFSPSVQALYFGGISLIPEPCATTFEETMRRNRGDRVIAFDPNIRPGFVIDEAAYRDRMGRMLAMSDLIKVSEEDFAWLEPDRPFEAVARAWLEEGSAQVVILTRGAGGARALTRSRDVTIQARPVPVVDTVGAGDTFNAGVLASLRAAGVLTKDALGDLEADTLRAALERGAQVAAVTVGRAGANPPWLAEL